MTYLLDTCVVSELVKPAPETNVVEWIKAQPSHALFLSAITVGEIRKGLVKLPDSKRKQNLSVWLSTLVQAYRHRILPLDLEICENWGILQGQAEKSGVSMSSVDGLLAATALTHHLIMVTRNEKDFAPSHIPTLNPWRL